MSEIVLTLNAANVGARSLLHLTPNMAWNRPYIEYMLAPPGQEHYRMLAEISHQLPDGAAIADVGTFYGASALALSSNPGVQVTTYDIARYIPYSDIATPLSRPNVTMKTMSGHADVASIARASFVLLDIDPHDGPRETQFVQALRESGFRGILACDDINLNPGMRQFWATIPDTLKKVDVTHLAHWSGTGLVVFDPSYVDVIVE